MRKTNYLAILLVIMSSLPLVAQPSNDFCSGAISIGVDTTSCNNSIIFSSTNTTPSGVPACQGSGSNKIDVWYKFTVPSQVNTVNLLMIAQSVLHDGEIYSGTCGSLVSVSCLNNIYSNNTSRAINNLIPDSTYYLRLYKDFWGSGSSNGTHSFEMCLFYNPPPANNLCSSAEVIPVGNQSCSSLILGNNQYATDSNEGNPCGFNNYAGRDIWYQFQQPAGDTSIYFDVKSSSGINFYATIYEGQCGSLNSIHCSIPINGPNANLISGLVPGLDYYIRIHPQYNYSLSLTFCVYTIPPPPTNDTCSGAISVVIGTHPCDDTTYSGTNISASDSGVNNNCSNHNYQGGDVWYSFVAPPNNNDVQIDLNSSVSSKNLFVEVLESSCGNLNSIYCSERLNTNADERITGLNSGNTYYLRFFEDGNNEFFDFQFCLYESPPPPVNNNCSGAIEVNVSSFTCENDTTWINSLGATSSGVLPLCNYSIPLPDIWYKFTVPTNASSVYIQKLTSGILRPQIFSGPCNELVSRYCAPSTSSNYRSISNLSCDSTYYLRFSNVPTNSNPQYAFCISYNQNLVVNSSDDIDDGLCDDNHCSLREAINASNQSYYGYTNISFDIPGQGPHIISPDYTFPDIEKSIVLDGTTQTNYYLGQIIIDGSNAKPYLNGDLNFPNYGQQMEVYGICFRNFSEAALYLVSDAIIGKVAKGNLFYGNTRAIRAEGDILISNNIFGKDENGNFSSNSWGSVWSLGNTSIINNEFAENVFTYDYGGGFGDISGNYIYNGGVTLEGSYNVKNNTFGKDPLGNTYSGSIGLDNSIGFGGNCISDNIFFNYNTAHIVSMFPCFDNNEYFCNDLAIDNSNYYVPNNTPVISSFNAGLVTGTVNNGNQDPFDSHTIYLYKSIDDNCSGATCQGGEFIGKTTADRYGNWSIYTYPSCIESGDNLTALAAIFTQNVFGDLTEFGPCFTVNNSACDSTTVNTYIVNTENDIDDGVCDSSHCSLREALQMSNTDNTASEVNFNLPGTGPFNIFLDSVLISLQENTIIDATTQPGYIDKGYINITKSTAWFSNSFVSPNLKNVLTLEADKNEVYGLSFSGFSDYNLIRVNGDSSIIGGPQKGNLFYDNTKSTNTDRASIWVEGESSIIQSNFVGVKANGIEKTTNLGYGIYLGGDSNLVGGRKSQNEGNTIGSQSDLIYIRSSSNRIEGNNLGLGADDSTDVGGNTGINHTDQFSSKNILGSHDSFAGNFIFNNIKGIDFWNTDEVLILNNRFGCNASLVHDHNVYPRPQILEVKPTEVNGISLPHDSVQVYIFTNDNCLSSPVQGTELLGTVKADRAGNWSLGTSSPLNSYDEVTALATDDNDTNTSQFSNSVIVYPSYCEFAQLINLNEEPCATSGAIVDMETIVDSPSPPTSICASSYAGNDAWFKIISPATTNSLVRINLNTSISAVAEAYIGNCSNLTLEQCFELDSLPQAMIFEGYTPGTEIYLRVWDYQNSIQSSGNGALLHLTAHTLSTVQEEWELCDEENNLINGNPTILSERDANSFIIEYEDFATPADIQEARDSLIAGGGSLIDSCLCGSNPLELWDHSNPIDMEENKKGARLRASVDTSNYNYKFESIEFLVNAYGSGEQFNADVAMDSEGNFIIVWQDLQRRHNYMRLYKSSGNPITVEKRIGASDRTQFRSRIAILDDGSYIVVWHELNTAILGSDYTIWGKIFNADGSDKTGYLNLSDKASASLSNNHYLKNISKYGINPEVSTDGYNFAIVWYNEDQLIFQRFDGVGNVIGSPKEIGNSLNLALNPNHAISLNTQGDCLVTFTAEDSSQDGIFCTKLDASSNFYFSNLLVNSSTNDTQDYSDVVLNDDGSFYVAWASKNQESSTSGFGVFSQAFDANGLAVGLEVQVNTYVTNDQYDPTLCMLDDGTFFIAWTSYGQDGSEEGIYGQFFDANSNPIANEFKLNTLTFPEQEKPSTATNGESVIIGVWEDGINDGDGKGIFGQRYEIIDAGGQKVYYSIGTATPSSLLGDELTYPSTTYIPTDSLASVRVAIIDTGVDPNHPYLSSAIWNNQQVNAGTTCYVNDTLGYDFVNDVPNPIDYDGHGTKVNGIIARDFPADIQLELMNLKFHEFQKGKVFDAVCAIYYAVDNGADIINMSWGFEASEYPAILKKAIQYASDNDVLMVTTAGNTSKDNDKLNKFPCNLDIPHMIRVTSYEYKSSNNTKKLANYASYGKNNVDIAAYGFVETPTLGDTLELASGTSLAAPHITRTAAIIKGLFPNLTAQEIKDCILNNAAPEAEFSNVVATGGILDHDAAIDCAYDKAANCVAIDLYINVPQSQDTVYRSDVWVETDTEINSNADVEMWGAEYVKMLPGFETTLGTEYLADIDDCDPLNTPNTLQGTGTKESSMLRLKENSVLAGKIKVQFYYEGQEQQMKIYNESGKEVQSYTFAPEKEGWYEKIIDAKLLPTGIYTISLEGEEKNEERLFQVQNKHYERYLLRAKKGAEE